MGNSSKNKMSYAVSCELEARKLDASLIHKRVSTKVLYYLLQKYITKNENSLFIDKKLTNYCSIMDQYLVWYPLASMTAAILRGMDS